MFATPRSGSIGRGDRQASISARHALRREIGWLMSSKRTDRRDFSSGDFPTSTRRPLADRHRRKSPRLDHGLLRPSVRNPFSRASCKQSTTVLRLDADVLELWLRSQGPGYQTRLKPFSGRQCCGIRTRRPGSSETVAADTYNSSYFRLDPRAFSTGYFSAFSAIFARAACSRSTPSLSASRTR